MTTQTNGPCFPRGFRAAGIRCGIRANRDKPDLALLVSDAPASAAAAYTTNLVKAAPLLVTRDHLKNGTALAVICNSGNANTCNADGLEVAEAMCALVERHLGVPAGEVVVASTGVIGQPLPIAPIAAGMPALCGGLRYDGGEQAARAIMTTDTFPKLAEAEFEVGGVTCRVGGMAKGSGMIHPDMATLLAFLTSDAAIEPSLLAKTLRECVESTLNMLSVDGDTSTNDMCCALANGLAGNEPIAAPGEGLDAFRRALTEVLTQLTRMLARDGEGATKLLACRVDGAKTPRDARLAARGVISSSLVKAAMFGADANWGRALCALGYSGADFDPALVSVAFESPAGRVDVCADGAGVPFSEEEAARVLAEEEVAILVGLHGGEAAATAWGCDLTYDYVKINGDYRT
ncbi:MAG: bifunctional glutamate N-acetyltransferase/amino-acid acetyltransferase ArgJ [Oscillospiraceae bacterium]|jgi:glutamate N-acetyltransferase/amino-acid N-acetyltransferase|nr:bifunctional glutamate N-acetyltransferase/amino-acid acetyltransferase ArgJ [Oscillospiraceae bacterium]